MGSYLPDLYLTDILKNMSRYMAFTLSVFLRGDLRKCFKRPAEMGLVGKIAIVGNFRQGQIGMVDQLNGVQVFFIEQKLLGIHAGEVEDFSGQVSGAITDRFYQVFNGCGRLIFIF